jgi:hypothetical protein
MSTKYVRELLESVDVLNPERACEGISEALQELRQIETARAKDAELIQRLVDGLKHAQKFAEEYGYGPLETAQWDLDAAEVAGFKPSDR